MFVQCVAQQRSRAIIIKEHTLFMFLIQTDYLLIDSVTVNYFEIQSAPLFWGVVVPNYSLCPIM